jgi:error-prone DNA polymerase
VRAPSVLHSDHDSIIEADGAIRLGLRVVRGVDGRTGRRIEQERKSRPFESLDDFRLRVAPHKDTLRTLAKSGALNGLVEHRRDGLWKVERATDAAGLPIEEIDATAPLPAMNAFERMNADFTSTGLTTGRHPMALIRDELPHVTRASDMTGLKHGTRATIAGMVICRQRPGTANGHVFISLEDETGISNAIVSPELFEQRRLVVTQESFLSISGIVQNARNTILLKSTKLEALRYGQLSAPESHDFR